MLIILDIIPYASLCGAFFLLGRFLALKSLERKLRQEIGLFHEFKKEIMEEEIRKEVLEEMREIRAHEGFYHN